MGVVGLFSGEPPCCAGQPVADLIERLEWLLEAARSGELQCLAGVSVDRFGVISVEFAGSSDDADKLIGGLERCKHTIFAGL